jgi:tetratricopeptide (TPR) repeat protein
LLTAESGGAMVDKDHIQSLLKEAKIYQTQGLLEESKEKYQEILEIVKTNKDLLKGEYFIDSVRNKIRAIDGTLDEIDSEPDTIELPEEVQNLIGKLFSFSKDEDTAAVESAVALATFGQYEKALSEFQKLLDKETLPMTVAKNMLQCHIALATHEAAISQFGNWKSDKTFTEKELCYLRNFLKNILERDGIKANLPQVGNASTGGEITENIEEDVSEEDISEILSVNVTLDDKQVNVQTRDFDVIFQLGNSIVINVKNSEKDLLSLLEPGVDLSKVRCYASFYFFNTKGVISDKKMVNEGSKRGDYSITLALENP